MTGVLIADRLPGMEQIPVVTRPVWGIDPSTRRVSVGIILPEQHARVHTLSMPTGHFARRLAIGHQWLLQWLPELTQAYGTPACVLIEEPMGATMSRVHPSSQRALGVLLSAIAACVPPTTAIDLCVPGTWKAKAVGHGRADKPQVMEWAQRACGYTGALQDEADALGVAWTAALNAGH